jgi:ferredoxin, 2Fe-2S
VPEVVFTERDGSIRRIEAPAGTSLMRVAVANGVEGIEAVCGGACACGTCHVYVAEIWLDRLTPPDETEDYMLDETDAERRPSSRLSCQIKLTELLSGIEVAIPREP